MTRLLAIALLAGCSFDTSLEGIVFSDDPPAGEGEGEGEGEAPPGGGEGEGESPSEGEGEGEAGDGALRLEVPGHPGTFLGEERPVTASGGDGPVTVEVVQGDAQLGDDGVLRPGPTVGRIVITASDGEGDSARATLWNLGDVGLWLRADALPAEPGPVGEWVDLTGQLSPLVPPDVARAPTLVAEGPRGASVRFADGDFLETPFAPGINGDRLTVATFLSASDARNGALQVVASAGQDPDGEEGAQGWALARFTHAWYAYFGGGEDGRWRRSGIGQAVRVRGWQAVVMSHTGESGTIAADGRLPRSFPIDYVANTGGSLRLGNDRADAGDGQWFEGHLSEVLIWGRNLLTPERLALSDYLADRFPLDSDGDTLNDALDSCPEDPGELTPEGSEPDEDGDGVGDDCDTCPQHGDASLRDIDEDGIGDVCDPDRDQDGVSNEQEDACGSNPDDTDDAVGDVDGDGVCNELDGCPEDAGDGGCVEAELPELFAQWRFDGDLRDSSGELRHLAAPDGTAPDFRPGLSGEAAALPAGASAPLPTASAPLAVRVRLHPDGEGDEAQRLLASEGGTLRMSWDAGFVTVGGLALQAPAPVGEWTEVTFVALDGDRGRLYVDGALVGEADSAAGILLDGELWVGSEVAGAHPLQGGLDDVAIWSDAIGDDRVWRLANREGPTLPYPVRRYDAADAGQEPDAEFAPRFSELVRTGFSVTARVDVDSQDEDAGDLLALSDVGGGLNEAAWRFGVSDGSWYLHDPAELILGPVAGERRALHVTLVGTAERLTLYQDGRPTAVLRRQAGFFGDDAVFVGVAPDEGGAFPGEIEALDIFDVAMSPEQVASLAGPPPCEEGCLVGGVCHPPGAREPDPDSCGTCVPERAAADWTDTCGAGLSDSGRAEFSLGQALDGGADLLISANGEVTPFRSLELSGDEWPDLVFVSAPPGPLQVFHGGPDGYADPASRTFATDGGTMHCSADIDLDGHTDLVLLEGGDGGNSGPLIYWGTPDGLTDEGATRLPQVRPYDLAVGDVDRDGRLDIVTTSQDARDILIFRGQEGGAGRAVDAQPLRLESTGPGALALADLDGDRRLDLAVTGREGESALFLTGGGALRQGSRVPWDATFDRARLTPVDYDGDGQVDVAAVDSGLLGLWQYVERRLTQAGRDELIAGDFGYLGVGDFDRDGRMNAVLRGTSHANARLWSLSNAPSMGMQLEPGGGAALLADLDGNGLIDVVTANHRPDGEDGVRIWFDQAHRGGEDVRQQLLDAASTQGGWTRGPGNVWDRRDRHWFESRLLNAGGPVIGGRIEWDADTPETTQVAFQVRAGRGADELEEAPWTGPGGSADTWYEAPGRLPADLDGRTHWQYRARLTRGRPIDGPFLREVTLSWSDFEGDARCDATRVDTGIQLDPDNAGATRLPSGESVFVGADRRSREGVVLLVDDEGRERWRAIEGRQTADALEGVCAHPDGGFLATGWVSDGDVGQGARYVRYGAGPQMVWDQDAFGPGRVRAFGCVWSGQDWIVAELLERNEQTTLQQRRVSERGGVGPPSVLFAAQAAPTFDRPATLIRGDDDEVIIVFTTGELHEALPRYVRSTYDGELLLQAETGRGNSDTMVAGRLFDDGRALLLGEGPAGARGAVLSRGAEVVDGFRLPMDEPTCAAALGGRSIIAGPRAGAAQFQLVIPGDELPGVVELELEGPDRPLALISRGDGGFISFVASPLTVLRHGPRLRNRCD